MALAALTLIGGALAFTGAMAYSELASLRPRAGGEYVYIREAYGPLAGFLTGWTSFVAGFSGAIAASSVALAEYVGRFVPAAGDATPLLTLPLPLVPLVLSRKTAVALLVFFRSDWARIIRGFFRSLGPSVRARSLVTADYSQVELRVLVDLLAAKSAAEALP